MTIFRSKLHRKWAAFFTVAGTAWEYSPVPTSHFWLPEFGCWFFAFEEEIPNETRKQLEKFNEKTEKAVVVGIGQPRKETLAVYCWDYCSAGCGAEWWNDETKWSIGVDGLLCIDSGNSKDSRSFHHSWIREDNFDSEFTRMNLSQNCLPNAEDLLKNAYAIVDLFDM